MSSFAQAYIIIEKEWLSPMSNESKENNKKTNLKKPSIIFIHGLCHGAWCWHKYISFFESHGYECRAFDLRGHGRKEPKNKDFRFIKFHCGIRFDEYCMDLDKEINMCNTKPIVIGHSMGGAVLQKYIECEENSSKIRAAVLLASIPRVPKGKSEWKYSFKMMRKIMFTPVSLLALFGIKCKKSLSKSAFFSGAKPQAIPQNEIDEYIDKLGREPLYVALKLSFLRLVFKIYEGNVPVCVVGSRDDALFAENELHATAEFYGTKAIIFNDMCHDLMLDPKYKKPAEAILEFINSRVS